MADTMFESHYNDSWAIVIGINKYEKVSPLDYACNDAQAVAETLKQNFSFPDENVVLLTDETASRERILAEFLGFSNGKAHLRRSGQLTAQAGYPSF